jgi:hypothetical protein
MRKLRALAMAAALLAAGGCSTLYYPRDPSAEQRAAQRRSADRELALWTTDRLESFADEAEFRAYLRSARRAAVARDQYWAGVRRHPRPSATGEQEVVVTGSRIPARNASITNVQEAGVDEGDIVKQIDRFLVVLQDGRLFAIDTGPGPGARLRLTDRMNVYRQVPNDRYQGTWYDEMLVLGDRIVVTGYSYPERASEISVFRLDRAGRFAREGTFFLSSNDYYDSRNYATRLVDGNLLIYTPLALNQIDPGQPIPWPLIRRWQPADSTPTQGDSERRGPQRRTGAWREARPLLAPTDIRRPLATTAEPVVHSFTLCPLGPERAGENLDCRSTAFVSSTYRQYYVSPTDAFLVSGPASDDLANEVTRANDPNCWQERPSIADVWPTQIYRIPIGGGDPGVIAIRGGTFDQFSMQARNGHFRLLLGWGSMRCGIELPDPPPPQHFAYLDIPLSAFSPVLRELGAGAYTALPSIGSHVGDPIADRFTEDYVVYGSLGQRRLREGETVAATRVVAVPVARPAAAHVLTVPHNVIRAEQAGLNVVLTGYRAEKGGLDVSLIDLRAAPRVAATHSFAHRFESEGRSHAFNSLIGADGGGLLALPTVPLAGDGERTPYWSRPSDMDFLRVARDGSIAESGRLETHYGVTDPDAVSRPDQDGEPDEDNIPGYSCEVSCTDWYGNSRPIFTDGRIFALLATELIEGRVTGGRISEVQRLDFARAPVPPR